MPKHLHLAELASVLTYPECLWLLREEQLEHLAWLSGSMCREHLTLGCTWPGKSPKVAFLEENQWISKLNCICERFVSHAS